MFDVKTQAEVTHLNVRVEAHGDESVPAIDVKLMLLAVPVDRLTSAVPGMADRFYDGDMVAVGEINPLTVQHNLENLVVKIADVELPPCDIKKGMKIHLQPEKRANVELQLQTQHQDNLAVKIMNMLTCEVRVEIFERQLSVVGMDQ